jgi:hypothetical protein
LHAGVANRLFPSLPFLPPPPFPSPPFPSPRYTSVDKAKVFAAFERGGNFPKNGPAALTGQTDRAYAKSHAGGGAKGKEGNTDHTAGKCQFARPCTVGWKSQNQPLQRGGGGRTPRMKSPATK